MSSETRDFRPFAVSKKLEVALKGVRLTCGDQTCEPGQNLLIEDRTFSQRSVSVAWCNKGQLDDFKHQLRTGAIDSGFDASLLLLVIAVRSQYLKLHETVLQAPLSNLKTLERVTLISREPNGARRKAFRSSSHGADIEASVCLARNLARQPMRAWRKSAWLTKQTFRLRCDAGQQLFRPEPLTDAERERLGLHHETAFFVEFDSGCDLAADLSATEVPRLWVDEELLTNLDQRRSSPYASLIQRQMVLHLLTNVIHEFARQASAASDEGVSTELEDLTYEDAENSLVGRVARMIAGPRATASRRNEALDMMRTNPHKAAAHAEGPATLRSGLTAALREET